MKIAKTIYKHAKEGFSIQVDSCNKKIAKCTNVDTGENTTFNRSKLEWMITNGVFTRSGMMEGWE